MMTLTPTFKKRALVGLFLCLVIALLFVVWTATEGVEGDPFTMNETMTYEPDGLFVFNFTAEKSFTITWELSAGDCQQKAGDPTGFYFWVADFVGYGVGGWKNGYILNKDNLSMFYDAGNCVQTDVFTAGLDYTVYLVLGNAGFFDPTDTPAQIKADHLRDLDEEGDIDAESIFLSAQTDASVQYTHNFLLTYPPTITVISPADDSEMTGAFTMTATYLNSGTYERLMMIFEEWHASSTCPVYGTDEWDAEVALGYFNYQSLPYFSPVIPTQDGTTTIAVSDLNAGTYNCIKCYFVSETTGAMSGALCPDYNLGITAYIPPDYIPTFYLPLTAWSSFYASTSVRYATSTPVFDTWAEAFEPLFAWVGNTVVYFQDYFDPDVAKAKGEEVGDAIASARGYTESIDDFFGGLPLSEIFLFYIITALVVIVYRIVRGLLNIIVP